MCFSRRVDFDFLTDSGATLTAIVVEGVVVVRTGTFVISPLESLPNFLLDDISLLFI